MSKVLVTGGVRSGKSRYAEDLLSRQTAVVYLTPGYPADPAVDPEWASRVADHRARRPQHWRTVETLNLAGALRSTTQPILLDCVGTWLARTLDEAAAWDRPRPEWTSDIRSAIDELVAAWSACPQQAVAVTNEVGWGVVPEHRSGRLFADLLGHTNSALAAASDRVVLMVAGRPLVL